jgi:RnfABCDGE-type electron transport complex C subunit
MSATEKLLSFRHGVHPEEYKEYTNDKVIERMPFVKEYFLPLSQHIGAPSTPLVKEGQIVKRGQKIADASGFVSVALHAPVDGTIEAVDLIDHPNGKTVPGIRIKTDPFSSQQMEVHPQEDKLADKEAFISAIQDAGIVGLGGAAFPAHVKFSIPEDKHCTHLMLNGCECEPFLTCDHRVMAEYAEELIDGTMLLQKHIRADHIHIAIEANKPDAIENLRKVIARENAPIEVVPLKVKYPQGAEKMMITAILGKEVPAGKTTAGCRRPGFQRRDHRSPLPTFPKGISPDRAGRYRNGPGGQTPGECSGPHWNAHARTGRILRGPQRRSHSSVAGRPHDGHGAKKPGCTGYQRHLRHPGIE